MTTELCTEANRLRSDWYAAEAVNCQQPGVISEAIWLARELYSSHLRTCPTCKARNAELLREAKKLLEPETIQRISAELSRQTDEPGSVQDV